MTNGTYPWSFVTQTLRNQNQDTVSLNKHIIKIPLRMQNSINRTVLSCH